MSTITCEISQDSPSVCLPLWLENPYRLVTLWDMLRLYADTFLKLLDDLKIAELEAGGIINKELTEAQSFTRAHEMGTIIRALKEDCETLNLRSARKQVRFITEWLTLRPADLADELSRHLSELGRRVREDLEDTVMYSLDASTVNEFYALDGKYPAKLPPETLWGQEVCSNFKSAIRDIHDAAECLTFENGTACVFHLMRVLEVALRALGKSLNNPKFDPKTNPSWDSILSKCDDELRQPYAKRSPEWQSDPSFFTDATANLRAVKDAWRNPTMHVEKNYDYEEALHVWRTVRAFMKHLATQLSE